MFNLWTMEVAYFSRLNMISDLRIFLAYTRLRSQQTFDLFLTIMKNMIQARVFQTEIQFYCVHFLHAWILSYAAGCLWLSNPTRSTKVQITLSRAAKFRTCQKKLMTSLALMNVLCFVTKRMSYLWNVFVYQSDWLQYRNSSFSFLLLSKFT